ncbi:hypothetical protein CBM2586_B40020 [Cupriavidus phytorum]|uniref:Uncharacterized protein n=1 Tax=Cupriavidus taiwanensis TaxID=164546 RepID=A0A375CLP8_9BURK|nr:hypothetical protein CBM2586_B40020 [Cupriavidus taiwanensis]
MALCSARNLCAPYSLTGASYPSVSARSPDTEKRIADRSIITGTPNCSSHGYMRANTKVETDMQGVQSKTAIVTGGATMIGEAVVSALVPAGETTPVNRASRSIYRQRLHPISA